MGSPEASTISGELADVQPSDADSIHFDDLTPLTA